jgi:hypothetical protein
MRDFEGNESLQKEDAIDAFFDLADTTISRAVVIEKRSWCYILRYAWHAAILELSPREHRRERREAGALARPSGRAAREYARGPALHGWQPRTCSFRLGEVSSHVHWGFLAWP